MKKIKTKYTLKEAKKLLEKEWNKIPWYVKLNKPLDILILENMIHLITISITLKIGSYFLNYTLGIIECIKWSILICFAYGLLELELIPGDRKILKRL